MAELSPKHIENIRFSLYFSIEKYNIVVV
jgi:hypothetical protein